MAATANKPNTTSTSSFVAEILATSGKLQMEDMTSTLEKLASRIDHVKVELYDLVNKKHVDFYPNLTSVEELTMRVEDLSQERRELTERIEKEVQVNLKRSSSQFDDIASQLQQTKFITEILEKLLHVDDTLSSMATSIEQGDYITAVQCQEKLTKLFKEPVHNKEDQIHALVSLQKRFAVLQRNLKDSLSESWKESIKWSLASTKKKCYGPVTNTLVIKKALSDKLISTVNALDQLGLLDEKLVVFGDRFFQGVLKPIVTCADVDLKIELDPATIKVTFAEKPSDTSQPPSVVFAKLQSALDFINERLMSCEIKSESNDTESQTLMTRFGTLTSERYLKYLTDTCLLNSVPSSRKDFENYHQTTSVITTFQEDLIKLGYLAPGTNPLSEFSQNVNDLFSSKKSQEILMEARDLVRSSILTTVKVGPETRLGDRNEEAMETESKGTQKMSKGKDKPSTEQEQKSYSPKLSPNTFRFPECQISQSVSQLLSLCYRTLHEASTSSQSVQLYRTTRQVVQLFYDVVPEYHKHNIQTLPQVAAIHHNDCMFLAHHLMTLGHQFRGHLPDSITVTFVDFVPRLRQLGTQCFLDTMKQQKTQLLESLKTAEDFQCAGDVGNQERGERAVKQVLHQLRHLAAVWRDVLPANLYCKAIGTLLNSVLSSIITSIINLEDISESDTHALQSHLSLLLRQAPLLFSHSPASGDSGIDSNSEAVIMKRVALWGKVRELVELLGASLQGVQERWSHGPLSEYFTANEVKQFVRAVFQNTTQRAHVLTKIH